MLGQMLKKYRSRKNIKRLKYRGTGLECDGNVDFVFPERISIGDYVYLGPGNYLNGRGGLEIGPYTILAPQVVVLTSLHDYKSEAIIPYGFTELLRPVKIERCVWIGMRSVIMPGVTIGEGSIIAAGAVVTKSCEPGTIMGGNPAVVIGHRDMQQYWQAVENQAFYLLLKEQHHYKKREAYDNRQK